MLAGLGTAAGLGERFTLRVESKAGLVRVAQDGSLLTVERSGGELLEWKAEHRLSTPADRLSLFFDGPAIELFLEPAGQCCSIALPDGGRPFEFHLESGGLERLLAFSALP